MEHAQQTFKLSVPSDTVNLVMIRDFFDKTARRSPISEIDLERLKLAVDEACANVIEHAYNKDSTKEITIHVYFDDVHIVVEVIDSGTPFDPTTHTPIDIKKLQASGHSGGMGIRIMQMATDELVSDTDGEGHNRLKLVKKFAK